MNKPQLGEPVSPQDAEAAYFEHIEQDFRELCNSTIDKINRALVSKRYKPGTPIDVKSARTLTNEGALYVCEKFLQSGWGISYRWVGEAALFTLWTKDAELPFTQEQYEDE